MSDEIDKIKESFDEHKQDITNARYRIEEIGKKSMNGVVKDYSSTINDMMIKIEQRTHKSMDKLISSVLNYVENKLQDHNEMLKSYNALMKENNELRHDCNDLKKLNYKKVIELNNAYKLINWNKIQEIIEGDKEASLALTENFESDDEKDKKGLSST